MVINQPKLSDQRAPELLAITRYMREHATLGTTNEELASQLDMQSKPRNRAVVDSAGFGCTVAQGRNAGCMRLYAAVSLPFEGALVA